MTTMICNAILCSVYILSVTAAAVSFGNPAILLWYLLVLLLVKTSHE